MGTLRRVFALFLAFALPLPAMGDNFELPLACQATRAVSRPLVPKCTQGLINPLQNDALSNFSKIRDHLSEERWLREKMKTLSLLRKHEIDRYKWLHRYLAFGEKGGPASLPPERDYERMRTDFHLLLNVVKEIAATRRKLEILGTMNLANRAPDLEEMLKQLQQLKIALLEKNHLLAGNAIEKLVVKRSAQEGTPTEAEFRTALSSDLSDHLAAQQDADGEDFKYLNGYPQASEARVLIKVFGSGVAEEDFRSPALSPIACSYLKKLRNYERQQKVKQDVIDVSLFVAPFLIGGEAGLVSRAFNLGKWARWGLASSKSGTRYLPSVASAASAFGLATWDATRLGELRRECDLHFSNYGVHPTFENFQTLSDCKERYASQALTIVAGIGVNAGTFFLRNLSPAIRTGIQETLSPTDGKKQSLVSLLAKDLGLGRTKLIQKDLREVERLVQAQKAELSRYSAVRVNKERDVQEFVSENALSREIDGHRVVSTELLPSYTSRIGKDTVELLYIPGAAVPHLPSSVQSVGHLAMRVGDKVYHQTGSSGFQAESFSHFLGLREGGRKVYGTVLQVSPQEKEIMTRYFNRLYEKQIPYSVILNNCSQAACKGLSLADVKKLPEFGRFDPLMVSTLIKRSDRVALKTLYNARSDLSSQKLKLATARNRAAFYGVPLLTGAGITYGGVEAVDLVIDYLDLLQASSLESSRSIRP